MTPERHELLGDLLKALSRIERHWPGVLANQFPQVDWKGAMGFRDVIAHQYFDLDEEQVLLICEQSLPEIAAAVRLLAAA